MNEYNSLSEQNNCIDLVKLFMSICVVAIHTHPLEYFSDGILLMVYNTLLSLAVPYFFVASGFLLFSGIVGTFDDKRNLLRIKKYGYKLVKSYLIWSLIFLPIAVYGYWYEREEPMRAIFFYARNFIFQGEHFYSWQLWYLLAAIIAVGLIWMLMRTIKNNFILWFLIAIILFFVAHYMDYLNAKAESLSGILKWIEIIFEKTFRRGRMFSGCYLMIFGILIANLKTIIYKLPLSIWSICMSLAFIVATMTNSSIALLVTIIALFIVTQGIKIGHNQKIFRFFRKTSMVIYYSHMLFFFLWSLFCKMNGQYGLTAFLITLICSLMLAGLVNTRLVCSLKITRTLFGAPVDLLRMKKLGLTQSKGV